jgi:hypothetical protein
MYVHVQSSRVVDHGLPAGGRPPSGSTDSVKPTQHAVPRVILAGLLATGPMAGTNG